MCNYVNEDAFFAWYDSIIADKAYNRDAVLSEVFELFITEKKNDFEIPAGKTVTGKPESYRFRAENIGCCGASTMFIYF